MAARPRQVLQLLAAIAAANGGRIEVTAGAMRTANGDDLQVYYDTDRQTYVVELAGTPPAPPPALPARPEPDTRTIAELAAAVTVNPTTLAAAAAVRPEDFADSPADALTLARAAAAGERPYCACVPHRAWPDGPVIGYVHECARHRNETIPVPKRPPQ